MTQFLGEQSILGVILQFVTS